MMYLGEMEEFYMTESEKRLHRVCFTGHRPEKLLREEKDIKTELETQIRRMIAEENRVFISGMARGVDIWAAEIVLNIRDEGADVKLICAVPYEGFEKGWNENWQYRYSKILKTANFVKYVCDGYSRSCFQIRNEWMVNHAAAVIAVFHGEKGGTKNTVNYARKIGVPVILIEG